MTWPQDAYVGQKVVCIIPKLNECSFSGVLEPDINEVGTISNIYVCPNNIVIIELIEFPQPGGLSMFGRVGPGWQASGFRPVQTTEKGMEILKSILNPKNHKALKVLVDDFDRAKVQIELNKYFNNG